MTDPAHQPTPDPAAPSADDARDLVALQRIRAGDPAAWRELIARHQDRLYALCVRMAGGSTRRDPGGADAADLCQTALVKIVQGLPTFDGRSQLSTWMIRITMNVCLSSRRASVVRQHASLESGTPEQRAYKPQFSGAGRANPAPAGELGPDHRVQSDEHRGIVVRALALVEADQRAILVLRDVRGLEYEQIAEVLGVPVGTVKSRLFRARESLRRAIEQQQGE